MKQTTWISGTSFDAWNSILWLTLGYTTIGHCSSAPTEHVGLRTVRVHTGYGCRMSATGTVPWAFLLGNIRFGYGSALCRIGWCNTVANGRIRPWFLSRQRRGTGILTRRCRSKVDKLKWGIAATSKVFMLKSRIRLVYCSLELLKQ